MPISLDVLRRVSVVYTHAHCPDGMATAMILKDAFRMLGMSPRIEFLAHGTPEHRAAGTLPGRQTSLFCDIAPVDNARVFAGVNEIVVLDHHKGAEELVRSFGELGVFADEKLEPGVSGASLAFREVWESAFAARPVSNAPSYREQVREFAEACGARDTWHRTHPLFQLGQWISKMLMSKPPSHWLGSESRYRAPELRDAPYLFEREIEAGRALFDAHEEAVRQAVEQCVRTFVEDGGSASTGTGFGDVKTGVSLFVFQEQASGFRLCSDVAESIRKEHGDEHGVVCGFCYVVDKPGAAPRLFFSLRGLSGFDVAAFAKVNGGGGHTLAAAFAIGYDDASVLDPYSFINGKLATFLFDGT